MAYDSSQNKSIVYLNLSMEKTVIRLVLVIVYRDFQNYKLYGTTLLLTLRVIA